MTAVLGVLMGLVSGVMTGSFSLPMKKTTRWSWEATWLIWSVCALLIIPWAIALVTTPDLFSVFSKASTTDLVLVLAFGMGWGLGAVFFGQSIAMIGISLAFALCIGLATALGALIPMLKNPEVFTTPGGMWSTAGIAVMILGVAICSAAGHRKDQQLQQSSVTEGSGSLEKVGSSGWMIRGLTLAALGGILSSMLNLAFNFSQSLKDAALAAGATASSAADPVWALTLLGGLGTNVVYCSILLSRNGTWSDYRKPHTASHWFLAALMAAIWMPSIALYGRAAVMMGPLGGSAGWGLYMGMVIVMSNVWGFVTGEWRGSHGWPVQLMLIGMGLLLVAIAFIGYGAALKA
jgi:L-rhamnose-H+ transport protein